MQQADRPGETLRCKCTSNLSLPAIFLPLDNQTALKIDTDQEQRFVHRPSATHNVVSTTTIQRRPKRHILGNTPSPFPLCLPQHVGAGAE
jgi:hypothetical protein